MSYTPVETSAFVAFVAFTDIVHDFPTQNFYDLMARDEETPATRALNPPNKIQKKIALHGPLEQKVEDACTRHHHSELYYPLIYTFSQSLQEILLTTAYDGSTIMHDLLQRKEKSLPYFTLKLKQSDYINQARQALHHNPMDQAAMVITQKLNAAKTVFDIHSSHSTRELHDLHHLATRVDGIKNAHPHLRIL